MMDVKLCPPEHSSVAFKQGYNAYFSKKGLRNNPYTTHSTEYEDYHEGFLEAEFDDHNCGGEVVSPNTEVNGDPLAGRPL